MSAAALRDSVHKFTNETCVTARKRGPRGALHTGTGARGAGVPVRGRLGIEPTPQPVGGGRFPVKYYITAMLFIVFDIEIIFLYPWAVRFDAMGYFGLVEMVLFIATVFVAYAYVWRRGGLEWD
jgi:hypothetical protein